MTLESALSNNEHAQAQIDRDAEMFADKAKAQLIEELMDGQEIKAAGKKYLLRDALLWGIENEDLAWMAEQLICRGWSRTSFDKMAKRALSDWLDDPGQVLVDERAAELAEEAREES